LSLRHKHAKPLPTSTYPKAVRSPISLSLKHTHSHAANVFSLFVLIWRAVLKIFDFDVVIVVFYIRLF